MTKVYTVYIMCTTKHKVKVVLTQDPLNVSFVLRKEVYLKSGKEADFFTSETTVRFFLFISLVIRAKCAKYYGKKRC